MQNMTPSQLFALAFGVVYLLVGLVGFAVTGFNGWFSSETFEKLIVFPLNGIHNVVHIGAGLVWMVSSSTHESSRRTNLILGIVFVVLSALGLAGMAKWAAIESGLSADTVLHLVTGAAALLFAFLSPVTRYGSVHR